MQAIGTSSTPSWVNGHKGQEAGRAVSCSWFDAKYPVGNLERDDKLTEAKLAREKTLHKLRRWQRQKQKRASGSESATTIASAGGSGASNAMHLVVSDGDYIIRSLSNNPHDQQPLRLRRFNSTRTAGHYIL